MASFGHAGMQRPTLTSCSIPGASVSTLHFLLLPLQVLGGLVLEWEHGTKEVGDTSVWVWKIYSNSAQSLSGWGIALCEQGSMRETNAFVSSKLCRFMRLSLYLPVQAPFLIVNVPQGFTRTSMGNTESLQCLFVP